MAVEFKAGLKDVVAVNSSITAVDGDQGLLRYRGYDIRDLAIQATYEEVVYLLWYGELPTQSQLRDVSRELAAARPLTQPVLASMRTYPKRAHPLEALRTAVSITGMHDPDSASNAHEATLRKATRLTAQIPVMVGAWQRLREGQDPVAPLVDGSAAENFLYTVTGRRSTPVAARTMDMIFILHADHEINASTFAMRVAVATFTDLHSAITAAIGTLKGPRHGGANEDVLEMLLEIGDPSRAARYIEERWEARTRMTKEERAKPENRIPGWGHPVYKVDDPRAGVLREMARKLVSETGNTKVFDIAARVFETMHRVSDLPVNVDFFSAVVYHALGIPIDLCTSIFAAARISGWSAHAMEQYNDKLLRPRAHYTGPPPRAFVPLSQRR
ncbi:MAG TPA: citrate/2-methylcitrate synthase [bacterium]|nr:citrate/2-methylcitrate synthase [bacterium]